MKLFVTVCAAAAVLLVVMATANAKPVPGRGGKLCTLFLYDCFLLTVCFTIYHVLQANRNNNHLCSLYHCRCILIQLATNIPIMASPITTITETTTGIHIIISNKR
ncbi:hypothetical protein BDF19DRAFT_454305 [Syncephalis fuscata]|nr:hypothetical protein BDF19DRAFT_454305 [Syncephalis fuscata]